MTTNLKEKLNKYFGNVLFLWALCLIFNIITFLFIFYKIRSGTQTLILHSNVLVGAEWYGKGKNLYFLPTIGLAILVVNFILYKKLKGSSIFYAPLCVFVSLSTAII